MKKLLHLFIILATATAGAQIVNIPDPVFKQGLLNAGYVTPAVVRAYNSTGAIMIIDTNNDDEIQISEAEAVWDLDLSTTFDIASLEGISAFSNLRKLNCQSNDLQVIDVTALSLLEELNCSNQNGIGLTNINVVGLQNLEVLNFTDNEVVSINLSGLPNLKHLSCGSNFLTTLDVSNKLLLQSLHASGNDLTSVNLTNTPALEALNVGSNNLSSFDLSTSLGLQSLVCSYNPLTELELDGLVNLQTLSCTQTTLPALTISGLNSLTHVNIEYNSSLHTLIVSNNPMLNMIFAFHCGLENVVLDNLPFFYQLRVHHNNIQQLDFSTCPNITIVHSYNNPLQFLNFKNGSFNNVFLNNAVGNTEVEYICVDDVEAEHFIDGVANYPEINLNSYCTVTPGGTYKTITGTAIYDHTNNGCDENDTTADFVRISIDDGNFTGNAYTGLDGSYTFYTYSDNVVLTPQFDGGFFNGAPASVAIDFSSSENDVITQDFCITGNGTHPDVEVVVVPLSTAQPGFDASYKIIYKNNGNQVLSGNITLSYDDAVLDYVSASPAESSATTGILTWNYSDLFPFENRNIELVLNVNSPMETPAVNIDDELLFGVSVTPLEGDELPEDNNFGFKQIVTGSFDPNDITCLEGEVVAPEKIGEYLHYNINFENTGTAPATFIVVKDVINEEQFDVNTLQLMYASHNVEVRTEDNKVEFYFDDIQLGPLEKGNIVFKIKTLNTLQVNDDVTQQAEIFFDYNWPIVTNEATTVFQTLSTGDFVLDNSVKVYPNPAESVVNLSANSNITSVQLYDVQGRLLQAVSPDDVAATLDISARAEGMYFIKIMTEAGIKVEKIVKK